jgi:hypothetical protein
MRYWKQSDASSFLTSDHSQVALAARSGLASHEMETLNRMGTHHVGFATRDDAFDVLREGLTEVAIHELSYIVGSYMMHAVTSRSIPEQLMGRPLHPAHKAAVRPLYDSCPICY